MVEIEILGILLIELRLAFAREGVKKKKKK